MSITAAPESERDKGRSCVRFLLEGNDAMGADPFDTLVPWYEEDVRVTLLAGDIKVEDCRLRECSLDLSSKRLYFTLYTPFSAQEVRHWFDV